MVTINLAFSRSVQIKRETQRVCKRLLFYAGLWAGLIILVNSALRFKIQHLQMQVAQLSHLLQQQIVSSKPQPNAMTPFNQMKNTFQFYQNRMTNCFQQLTQPGLALCMTECHQTKQSLLLKGYAFSQTQLMPLSQIAHLMHLKQSTTDDRLWFQYSLIFVSPDHGRRVGDEGQLHAAPFSRSREKGWG